MTSAAKNASPESPATAAPAPTVLDQVHLSPGWTNYTNGNFVFTLARQEDYLWAGGNGGLVRWDLSDHSHIKLGREDGLASNRINDLLVDGAGVLWIATDAGVTRNDGDGCVTSVILRLFAD